MTCILVQHIVKGLVESFDTDEDLRRRVLASNEPYRALAWECGLEILDGTDLWHDIMDAMDDGWKDNEHEQTSHAN